jgi:hypothetical protein
VDASAAHPGVRVERVAAGESAREWRRALEAFDPGAAATLKEDGDTGVYLAEIQGRAVVLKRWELRTLGARLKAVVRAGRADRHWRGAAWLAGHGIRTARTLALATEHRRGRPRRWLVMEALQGRTVLEHLSAGDLSVRQEHAVARRLGAMLIELQRHGRMNRDSKPSNLIVVLADSASPEVAIVDCVAIRRSRAGVRDLTRMFASLYIEPLGCGCPPRRGLAMAAVHGAWWELDAAGQRGALRLVAKGAWRAAARVIAAHGDPTPRVNPLVETRPAINSDR